MKYYILIFAGISLMLSCQYEQVQTESNPEFQNIRKKIISNVNLAGETNNSSEKKKLEKVHRIMIKRIVQTFQ